MATRDPNFKDIRGNTEHKPALTPADKQGNLDRNAQKPNQQDELEKYQSMDDRIPPQTVKRTPEGTREEGIEEQAP